MRNTPQHPVGADPASGTATGTHGSFPPVQGGVLQRRLPAVGLIAALIYLAACAALTVGLALQVPWLGLTLRPDRVAVVVQSGQGPSAGVEAGARLVALTSAAGGEIRRVELQAQDLAEEPDMVDDYLTLDAFFERQGRIAALLAAPQVTLELETVQGRRIDLAVTPAERSLSSLPLRFWFQMAVAALACLIATWVWVLRPTDRGAAMFGLTGLLLPLSALSAAVYGARELALPQSLFQGLSAVNHGSSALWGAAFVGIFMVHPKPLLGTRWLVAVFGIFGLWWLIGQLRWVDSLDWGIRLALVGELLLAAGLGAWQWRRSRSAPLERAAMRWLLLSLLLGSSLFIATIIVTVTLGWLPPLPQGYAFGFFLLIYVGIALGLRRYRLFELDTWAYRMLAWAGGAVAVLAVDALLIVALDWSQGTALGVSLWICGLLYFPARQLLWSRLVRHPRRQLAELMPDIVAIAFQPAPAGRQARWDTLLAGLFDPLSITARPDGELTLSTQDQDRTRGSAAMAAVAEEGLALHVPACAGVPGRCLRHAARGRRLFAPQDATFIGAVCALMDEAAAGRDAHERGAAAERRRIAQDMHDDVGARLLMLIHRAPTADLAELARAAMNDLRAALSALEARPMALADALADWRAEATQRCEAAGVQLSWQGPSDDPRREAVVLPARQRLLLERALREGLTNALKHAAPRKVTASFELGPHTVGLALTDDGRSGDPALWPEGRGLRGMRQRLRDIGGSLKLDLDREGRTRLRVDLPLQPPGPTS